MRGLHLVTPCFLKGTRKRSPSKVSVCVGCRKERQNKAAGAGWCLVYVGCVRRPASQVRSKVYLRIFKIQDDICWRGHLRTKGLTGRDLLAEELPPHAFFVFNDRLVRCDQGGVEASSRTHLLNTPIPRRGRLSHLSRVPTSSSSSSSSSSSFVAALHCVCNKRTLAKYTPRGSHCRGDPRSEIDGASFFVAHLDAKKAR